jgi:hypothetical protein
MKSLKRTQKLEENPSLNYTFEKSILLILLVCPYSPQEFTDKMKQL